jgi:ribosomal protein S18 acetylase RimI-like enzyme
VITLWEQCGLTRPWNDPRKDIRRKLALDPDRFLVCLIDKEIVGTIMVGYEGLRGWVNYLAVAPNRRGQGSGRALMEEAERRLLRSGCPKINLQVRTTNQSAIAFYHRLGYVMDEVVSMGKRLEHDERSN